MTGTFELSVSYHSGAGATGNVINILDIAIGKEEIHHGVCSFVHQWMYKYAFQTWS